MSTIWRKKPLSAFKDEIPKSELKRVLGKWSLTAIGVGAIIGGGIFVLTGTGAYYHAGPALAISFIIAGIACIFSSFQHCAFRSLHRSSLLRVLLTRTLTALSVNFLHG